MKMKFKSLVFVFTIVLIVSCSKDDNITAIPSSLTSKTYTVSSIYNNSVDGKAKFIKNDDNSTTVELRITSLPAGSPHPVTINYNTAAEGGSVAVTLGMLNDNTGSSSFTFSALDDGTPITYDDMLSFDGYLNVAYSSSQPNNIIAQADIGENALTGVTKTYVLGEKDLPQTSAIVIFYERRNGESLALIQVTNAVNGEMYPAFIYNNSAVETGNIVFTFNPIDGDTGVSATNIKALDDATAFLYSDIVNFDGHINISESQSNIGTIIAQGDIGENELTGVFKTYVLSEVDVPNVFGTATFYERYGGEALAVIYLENTPANGVHPAFIYSNDVATTGSVIFTFNPIDGDTGISKTNVSALDDATEFVYEDVLTVNAHIKVQLSSTQPTTIIAEGNMGAND